MSIKQALFSKWGLASYTDCVMGEMQMRPVPHMFEAARVAPLRELYARRAPALFEHIMRGIEPPIQPLNKLSKLGWPWIQNVPSKRAVLLPELARLYSSSAEDMFSGGWMQIGIRLQPEEAEKERVIMVVDDEGEVKETKVTKKERAIRANDTYDVLAPRTRLIISPPSVGNQAMQPLDTAIHNWFISHPGSFGHDLNTPGRTRIPHGYVLMLDMKNFDRFTGPVWVERARIVGGLYNDICSVFRQLPYLSVSSTRKSLWWLWPRHDTGMELQFGSGISAVAPIQKEIFYCIYGEFAERVLGVSARDVHSWVMRGGDARFGFLNYGDDNAVFGDKSAVTDFHQFIGEFLEAVPEDPPKFLGFLWDGKGFKLGTSSYLLKTWLNEREPYSRFRKYPMHGWIEKRATYQAKGVPEMLDVFQHENSLLEGSSMDWPDIEKRAREELNIMSRMFQTPRVRALLATEKEYQLTAEETMQLPGYEGFYPSETREMIRKIVDPKWLSVLK